MTTGRVCARARATGSTRCTRACVRGERGERTGGSLSTGAKYSLVYGEATRLSRLSGILLSFADPSQGGHLALSRTGEFRRRVFRRVEEWSWATRCAADTPLRWEIRRMRTSMTSRRSVPAGEVFDVSVLTAREGEEGGERFGGSRCERMPGLKGEGEVSRMSN